MTAREGGSSGGFVPSTCCKKPVCGVLIKVAGQWSNCWGKVVPYATSVPRVAADATLAATTDEVATSRRTLNNQMDANQKLACVSFMKQRVRCFASCGELDGTRRSVVWLLLPTLPALLSQHNRYLPCKWTRTAGAPTDACTCCETCTGHNKIFPINF